MISTTDLLGIVKERLADVETLLKDDRYNGAVYLCGYAVEIALKHKICLTLNWDGFPSSNREFEKYKSLKTHDLDALLSFTGIEKEIREDYLLDWSAMKIWNLEARYNRLDEISSAEAEEMINSAKIIINAL